MEYGMVVPSQRPCRNTEGEDVHDYYAKKAR